METQTLKVMLWENSLSSGKGMELAQTEIQFLRRVGSRQSEEDGVVCQLRESGCMDERLWKEHDK